MGRRGEGLEGRGDRQEGERRGEVGWRREGEDWEGGGDWGGGGPHWRGCGSLGLEKQAMRYCPQLSAQGGRCHLRVCKGLETEDDSAVYESTGLFCSHLNLDHPVPRKRWRMLTAFNYRTHITGHYRSGAVPSWWQQVGYFTSLIFKLFTSKETGG